jgi:NAD+ diphosphatase
MAWWVLVREEEIALRPGPVPAVVVLGHPVQDGILPERSLYLGRRGTIPCYAGVVGAGTTVPGDWQFMRVRDLFVRIPDEELAIAAYAVRMVAYDRNMRFCGRCGNETRPVAAERARKCPACGLVIYPRLSPAIIVLIQRGDSILLARSPRFPSGMYGLIAGFVEPGEDLEHALVREVKEETGIFVKNIRYFGSEPWPFPDSLMIGFIAEYAGGELAVDAREIESAFWSDREHLPRIPEKLSISRALIDWWLEEGAGGRTI